jgi:hypothetical protein
MVVIDDWHVCFRLLKSESMSFESWIDCSCFYNVSLIDCSFYNVILIEWSLLS